MTLHAPVHPGFSVQSDSQAAARSSPLPITSPLSAHLPNPNFSDSWFEMAVDPSRNPKSAPSHTWTTLDGVGRACVWVEVRVEQEARVSTAVIRPRPGSGWLPWCDPGRRAPSHLQPVPLWPLLLGGYSVGSLFPNPGLEGH